MYFIIKCIIKLTRIYIFTRILSLDFFLAKTDITYDYVSYILSKLSSQLITLQFANFIADVFSPSHSLVNYYPVLGN